MRAYPLAIAFLCLALTPAKSGSLSGIPGPLASKVEELRVHCGAKVVSAWRHGARKPNGSISDHALGKAVDVQGNPSCMYARLKGWPGGMSTDYWSAPGGPHIHLSYNPQGAEWGRRFAHRSPFKAARQLASAR